MHIVQEEKGPIVVCINCCVGDTANIYIYLGTRARKEKEEERCPLWNQDEEELKGWSVTPRRCCGCHYLNGIYIVLNGIHIHLNEILIRLNKINIGTSKSNTFTLGWNM